MTKVSGGLRKAAAVSLLFALLWVVAVMVVQPILDADAQSRNELELLSAHLTRLESAASPSALAKLKTPEASSGAGDLYYAAEKPDVVAAHLQQSIGNLIRAQGGELRMARALNSKREDQVMVAFSFAISHVGLVALLHGVETARPVALVDKVAIRVGRAFDSSPNADPAGARGPFRKDAILDVSLEASAFVATSTLR